MSYWGARTGYAYESQRVSFLREIYKTERRHRELSLSPRVNPGMAALTASMAASPCASSSSLGCFGGSTIQGVQVHL